MMQKRIKHSGHASIKTHAGEKGAALVLVIILMLVGFLVVTPLLQFMGTGLKAGVTFEGKTKELYAADAGIEDAKWQIKSGAIETDTVTFPAYSQYDFETTWPYTLSEPVNGITPVSVNISNVWIPKDIVPNAFPNQARDIIEVGSDKLIVIGKTAKTSEPADDGTTLISQYTIEFRYTPVLGEHLLVTTIGVWLPPGYDYFSDPHHSSNLEGLSVPYRSIPTVANPWAGNKAVIWNFASPPEFTTFPSPPPATDPLSQQGTSYVLSVTFWFRPVNQEYPDTKPNAVSWIKTNGVSDIPYSWDPDVRVFRLVSTAGDTTVESYMAKNEIRKLQDAISGNYFASGNTWEIPDPAGDEEYRDWLFKDSTATYATASDGTGIPESATVEYAYLYWSGWQNSGMGTDTVFLDNASNFVQDHTTPPIDVNWTPGGTGGGNTGWLSPTQNSADTGGDGNGYESNPTGAYTNDSLRADNIDGANDRHRYYGYDTSSIPASSSIAGIEVRLDWWLESTSSANSMDVELSWDGGTTWTLPKNASDERTSDGNPTDTLGGASDTWGHSWTTSQLSAANFRVRVLCKSSNSNRDFYLDWIPVRITYTGTARWTIYNGQQFQGQGSSTASVAERTLTMAQPLDLHLYAPGSVTLSWTQSESGTLNAADSLRYAYYTSSMGWSTDYIAFADDISPSSLSVKIPDDFLKSDFKLRLYMTLNDTSKYVRVDDITVSVAVDPVVQRKVNRVLVTAGTSDSTQVNAQSWKSVENDYGWSYSCFADVTPLVNTAIRDGDLDPNGSGPYTVGHVIEGMGTTLRNSQNPSGPTVGSTAYPLSVPAQNSGTQYQYSYGGWSLIMIYSSPDTTGHQLYLFDEFANAAVGDALVFPVSGFIVPDPVSGETVAARVTCFIGDGDKHYAGDFFAVNDSKLFDGIELTADHNSQAAPLNVWNSQSSGIAYANGIDIDTFVIPWGSPPSTGIVKPKDVKATVNMGYQNVGDIDENLNFIYMILSFRSETNLSGAFTYIIR